MNGRRGQEEAERKKVRLGLRDIAARLNETAREKKKERREKGARERFVDAPANRRPDAYSFDFLRAAIPPPQPRDSENSNNLRSCVAGCAADGVNRARFSARIDDSIDRYSNIFEPLAILHGALFEDLFQVDVSRELWGRNTMGKFCFERDELWFSRKGVVFGFRIVR